MELRNQAKGVYKQKKRRDKNFDDGKKLRECVQISGLYSDKWFVRGNVIVSLSFIR